MVAKLSLLCKTLLIGVFSIGGYSSGSLPTIVDFTACSSVCVCRTHGMNELLGLLHVVSSSCSVGGPSSPMGSSDSSKFSSPFGMPVNIAQNPSLFQYQYNICCVLTIVMPFLCTL